MRSRLEMLARTAVVFTLAATFAGLACAPPRSALTRAISADDAADLDSQIRGGADANLTDDMGRPSLTLAASLGFDDIVERLLAAGAKVDARDARGATALQIAAGAGHVNIVKRLLAAGADVGVRDSSGRTAMDIVREQAAHSARAGDEIGRDAYFAIAAMLSDAASAPAASGSASAVPSAKSSASAGPSAR